MIATLLLSVALLAPGLFETPEYVALQDFTEEMSMETGPVTGEERMELYDQSGYFYILADNSLDNVLESETARLSEELRSGSATLLGAHQQRVRKATKRIRKQNLPARIERARIKKMRSTSYQKYLRDRGTLQQKHADTVAQLQEEYWDANRKVSGLQMLALQYIDLLPAAN